MKLLEWKDNYVLGIPAVDLQHGRIFDCFETIAGGSTKHDGLLAEFAMVQLIRLLQEHFALEESMMRTLCYPGVERHMEEHRQIHADVHELAQNSIRTKGRVSRTTIQVAQNWLRQHILVRDKHYVDYFLDPLRPAVAVRILPVGTETKRESDARGQ